MNFTEELISINDIILPAERMRKDFGDLDELALDIEANGQLNPVTCNSDYTLIAGERRYLAMMRAGIGTIRVSVPERELDETEVLIIEHTENVKRKDFAWPERVKAEAAFVQMMKKKDPKITAAKIARKLNISSGWLSISIQLAAASESHPEVWEGPNKEQAYKTLKKQLETAMIAEQIERRTKALKAEETHVEERESRPEDKVKESLPAKLSRIQKRVSSSIICGDFLTDADRVKDGTISLALLDPPWGVDIEKQSALSATKRFNDEKEYALDLLDNILGTLYPKLSDPAIVLLFFPIEVEFYNYVHKMAKKHGFRIEKTPMMWFKAMESVHNQNPHGSPGVVYEPIYFLVKGMPYLMKPVTNVYLEKLPSGRVHPTQKPMGLYKQLIADFSKPGDTILDPTYGSGSSMSAAESFGNRGYIGWDINELCYVRAIDMAIQTCLAREEIVARAEAQMNIPTEDEEAAMDEGNKLIANPYPELCDEE